ncbi:hypothetical protein [Aquihabitans sp. McL0605]|uniref:hypothetical protein n=1 Tax=Aquihabitans sp. McL0605 TaxID=3415671 RepID=UPI003CF5EB5D
MKDFLRGLAAAMALSTVVLATTLPAGAWTTQPPNPIVPWTMYPGGYCALGGGAWGTQPGAGGTHYQVNASTVSQKTPSGSGSCTATSSAPYNTMAVQARIQKQTSSGWVDCKSTLVVYNAANSWYAQVNVDGDVLGCGSGNYRLATDHRIIYGGTPQYKTFTSSSVAL